MFPVLLKTPFFTIYSYGVFLASAYLVAMELGFRKGEQEGYDPQVFSNFVLLVIVSAFAGSRALYVWLEWPSFAAEPWRAFFIWEGGLVFYGGLLGCLAACVPYVYRHPQLQVLRLADLAMPSVAIGHAIGRVGCLGVGCCYGAPTDVAWGIQLANLPPGMIVHPVQAYAAASLFVLWRILEWQWAKNRNRYPGWVFLVYCYYQSVHRYTMEVFRSDPRGGTFHFGMTISQEVAVGLGILALTLHTLAWKFVWPKYADQAVPAIDGVGIGVDLSEEDPDPVEARDGKAEEDAEA